MPNARPRRVVALHRLAGAWRGRLALTLVLLPGCGGDGGGAAPVLSVLARGIQFLPTAQLTSEQYRPTVASNGVDVFFSDSSDAPLKKVSIQGGAIAPLAAGEISQRLPRFTLSGSTLLVADGALIKSVPATNTAQQTYIQSSTYL